MLTQLESEGLVGLDIQMTHAPAAAAAADPVSSELREDTVGVVYRNADGHAALRITWFSQHGG